MAEPIEIGFFERLRDELQPQGSLPVVGLRLKPASYFDKDFVSKCINEVAKAAIAAQALGEPLSATHKLALQVLADSAYLELNDDELTKTSQRRSISGMSGGPS